MQIEKSRFVDLLLSRGCEDICSFGIRKMLLQRMLTDVKDALMVKYYQMV